MILFRPVGLHELELIARSGWREFPARLPEQPIFYPVLNQGYAEQIARDWNTTDLASGFAGFVLEFEVDDEHAAKYPREVVGAREHEELWVPAEELRSFNSHIVGAIRAVRADLGEQFTADIDEAGLLPAHLEGAGEAG